MARSARLKRPTLLTRVSFAVRESKLARAAIPLTLLTGLLTSVFSKSAGADRTPLPLSVTASIAFNKQSIADIPGFYEHPQTTLRRELEKRAQGLATKITAGKQAPVFVAALTPEPDPAANRAHAMDVVAPAVAIQPLISPHAAKIHKRLVGGTVVWKKGKRHVVGGKVVETSPHFEAAWRRSAPERKILGITSPDKVVATWQGRPITARAVLSDIAVHRLPAAEFYPQFVAGLSKYGFTRIKYDTRFAEVKYGLKAGAIHNLAGVESGYYPGAISPKRAMGLVQFMPDTAKGRGLIDPFEPIQAVDAAARLMKDNLVASGGDYAQAYARYNWGDAGVNRAIANNKGVFSLAYAPRETQRHAAGAMRMAANPGIRAIVKTIKVADRRAEVTRFRLDAYY